MRPSPAFLAATITLLSAILPASANEASYAATPVGTTEVKTLPGARVIEASADGSYFASDTGLFRSLFGYIKSQDLAMTVPVEADVEPARMRFFVERGARTDLPGSRAGVALRELPERNVASVGLRGGYSRENFEEGVARLREWLDLHPEWQAGGPPYAVYWNGPFVPWFLKRSEVHVPIVPR